MGIVLHSYAMDKAYGVFLKSNLEQSTQEFLALYSLESNLNRLTKFEYSKSEIDAFLKLKYKDAYEGYHEDIGAYVDFFMSLPELQIKVWFTMDELYHNKLDDQSVASSLIWNITRSRMEHSSLSISAEALLPYPISLINGNSYNQFQDLRWNTLLHHQMRKNYFLYLSDHQFTATQALAMNVLGAATLSRIPEFDSKSYWQLYPDIEHDHRDFYAAMWAADFFFEQLKVRNLEPLKIENHFQPLAIKTDYFLHFNAIEEFLPDASVIRKMNRIYFKNIVPMNCVLEMPLALKREFLEKQASIAQKSAVYIHQIEVPFCLVARKYAQSDHLDSLLMMYENEEESFYELNYIDKEIFASNRTIFFKVPIKDSTFFANLNEQSMEQMLQARKERAEAMANWPEDCKPKEKSKKVYHTVKSGDNLGSIARKYRVTINQLMKWNNLKSSTIRIGQKLVVKNE